MFVLRAAGRPVRAAALGGNIHRSPGARSRFCTEAASNPANKTQVYISRSRDPLLNLSVEHHLLQKSPPESTILLLYINSPCVIFGRNQNPWLETNLSRLAQIALRPNSLGWRDASVQLVRRRSGGGTVFHDEGNVNFSVICPSDVFNRDKHAEMVVRALKSLGRPNTRVNERHDIVVDIPPDGSSTNAQGGTFKISGSAYKLTRLRSLHHGTCLLRSPNLTSISGMLRSPAEGFVLARGVDSVRSPVRNVDLDNDQFLDAVVSEFAKMHWPFDIREEFDESALEVDKIRAGYAELGSRDWVYGQTPRFTFCTHPHEADPRPREKLPFDMRLHFEARHGVIEKFSMDGARFSGAPMDSSVFEEAKICDIYNWVARLADAGLGKRDAGEVGAWLNSVMGTEFTKSDRRQ